MSIRPVVILVECKESEKGEIGMTAKWCGCIVMVVVVTSLVPNLVDAVSISVI